MATTTGPVRIFLVEDSPILRQRLTEMLASSEDIEIAGHAETESAAETALKETSWDLLILDLQLLQGTGLGVLRTLASHRKPDTTVIVYTNYAIPLYRMRSMQLGADHFFDKAQEFDRIKDVLADVVEKKQHASH